MYLHPTISPLNYHSDTEGSQSGEGEWERSGHQISSSKQCLVSAHIRPWHMVSMSHESKRKCEMEKFVRQLVLIDIRYTCRHVESGFLQLPKHVFSC